MISAYETDKLPQGYYTYSGTVLLRRESSGSGMSLLLLLRDLGMRWVSAPGAAGKKSRFGGATEPLVWAEFHLYQSTGGLYLQNAEVKEDFLSVRTNAKKLLAAALFYKKTKQVLIAGHESNQILTILWNAMLSIGENCPEDIVEFRFNWRLLKALGLAPSLRSCCKCDSPLNDELNWSENGLLCAGCAGAKPQPQGALASLQRAALLEQRSFVVWSKKQTEYTEYKFFREQSKKIVIFFSKFS